MNTYAENKKLQKVDSKYNYGHIWHLRSRDFGEKEGYIGSVSVYGSLMKTHNFENYLTRITIGFEI